MQISNSQVMTKGEKRAAFSLASLFSLRMLGLFMIMPVFALYGTQLEFASPALIGVAIGVYGLTQAMFQIPFGLLSDRIGRKPVIVAGLVLFAVGGAIAAQSDSIYGVIIGRGIQGAGAIASAIMALLGDVTREEQRTKAMALIGMSIGVSFSLALVIGPLFTKYLGLSGLFWITVAMAILGLFICFYFVPTPNVKVSQRDAVAEVGQLKTVLSNMQLLRLDVGVFLLHLVMTSCFVALPLILKNELHIEVQNHWHVYLPILIGSFLAMVPLMIIAEKRRKIKEVFVFSISVLAVSLTGLFWSHESLLGLCIWLFLYFFGFNLLEAMLPSLVSKIAPAGSKGSCMGVFSSSQFLGAFAGGVSGGILYGRWGAHSIFAMGAVLMLVWLVVALSMSKPRFLQSYMVNLETDLVGNVDLLIKRFLDVKGVEEAVVVVEDKAVYLKVDQSLLDFSRLESIASEHR